MNKTNVQASLLYTVPLTGVCRVSFKPVHILIYGFISKSLNLYSKLPVLFSLSFKLMHSKIAAAFFKTV